MAAMSLSVSALKKGGDNDAHLIWTAPAPRNLGADGVVLYQQRFDMPVAGIGGAAWQPVVVIHLPQSLQPLLASPCLSEFCLHVSSALQGKFVQFFVCRIIFRFDSSMLK